MGSSLEAAIAAIPAGAEAVYVTPLTQLPPGDFDRLIRALIDRRLPTFSCWGRSDVERGLLMSLYRDAEPPEARPADRLPRTAHPAWRGRRRAPRRLPPSRAPGAQRGHGPGRRRAPRLARHESGRVAAGRTPRGPAPPELGVGRARGGARQPRSRGVRRVGGGGASDRPGRAGGAAAAGCRVHFRRDAGAGFRRAVARRAAALVRGHVVGVVPGPLFRGGPGQRPGSGASAAIARARPRGASARRRAHRRRRISQRPARTDHRAAPPAERGGHAGRITNWRTRAG